MQKNIQQTLKRISTLTHSNPNPLLPSPSSRHQILLLSQIARLKRFKYEPLPSSELHSQISSLQLLMTDLSLSIKHTLPPPPISPETQSLLTTIELYENVIEVMMEYLGRDGMEGGGGKRVTFVEEKRNRLCPVCETGIEENRLNLVRKYVDETWVSGLTLQPDVEGKEAEDDGFMNHEDIDPQMEESEYIKTRDKILANKKAYSYKVSHTSTVLQQTFKMDLQKKTGAMQPSFSDKDIRSAKDAMEYALAMLGSEFKGDLIGRLVPVLMKLIMRFEYGRKEQREKGVGEMGCQTEEVKWLKELKVLEERAEVLHRNLYFRENEVEELKKVVKRLEVGGRGEAEEREGEIVRLRNEGLEGKEVRKGLEMEVKRLEELVEKLQRHLRGLQVLEERRSSKRGSIRVERVGEVQAVQERNLGREREGGNSSEERVGSSISSSDTDPLESSERKGKISKRRGSKQSYENNKTTNAKNKGKRITTKKSMEDYRMEIKQDTEREKEILKSKMIRNMSKMNLKHYNKNLVPVHGMGEGGEKGVGKTRQGDEDDEGSEYGNGGKGQLKRNRTIQHSSPTPLVQISSSNQADEAPEFPSPSSNPHKNSSQVYRTSTLLKTISKISPNRSFVKKQSLTVKEPTIKNQDENNVQEEEYESQFEMEGEMLRQNEGNQGEGESETDVAGLMIEGRELNCRNQSISSKKQNKKCPVIAKSEHPPQRQSSNLKGECLRQQVEKEYPPIFQPEELEKLTPSDNIEDSRNESFLKSLITSFQPQPYSQHHSPTVPAPKISKHTRYPSLTEPSPLSTHPTADPRSPAPQPTTPPLTLTLHPTPLPSTRPSALSKLFSPKDLSSLFGSIQQAYHFESPSLKPSPPPKLPPPLRSLTSRVFKHLMHLKKNHVELYNWVKNFLKFPYQTVINGNGGSDLVSGLSEGSFEGLFGRILAGHGGCREVEGRGYCGHVREFLGKIRFREEGEEGEEKVGVVFPVIQKK